MKKITILLLLSTFFLYNLGAQDIKVKYALLPVKYSNNTHPDDYLKAANTHIFKHLVNQKIFVDIPREVDSIIEYIEGISNTVPNYDVIIKPLYNLESHYLDLYFIISKNRFTITCGSIIFKNNNDWKHPDICCSTIEDGIKSLAEKNIFLVIQCTLGN